MKSKKSIVILSQILPFGSKGGLNTFHSELITYLKDSGFTVHYVYLRDNFHPPGIFTRIPHHPPLDSFIVTKFFQWDQYLFSPRQLLQRFLNKISTFFHLRSSKPDSNDYFDGNTLSDDLVHLSHDCITRFKPCAVLAFNAWNTLAFSSVALTSFPLKIAVTTDVLYHQSNLLSQYEQKATFPPVSIEQETQLLSYCDAVTAVTHQDAATFKSMLPKQDIIITHSSAPVQHSNKTPVEGRCLFVGSPHPPNLEGIHWFMDHCWPKILSKIPIAQLEIAGKIGQSLSKLPDRVYTSGAKNSLSDTYAEAQVVIIPLLAGTGIKIKLIEAMANGKACVCTPASVKGLDFMSENTLLISNDPDEFAHHVCQLFNNRSLREELEQNANQAASQFFSPEICFQPLVDYINNRDLV